MSRRDSTPMNSEWETEEAVIERPVSAVVSVRFPADVAQRAAEEAGRRGLALSTFVRLAVEEYWESCELSRSAHDLTVSSPDGSVFFYGGRSANARTAGRVPKIENLIISA